MSLPILMMTILFISFEKIAPAAQPTFYDVKSTYALTVEAANQGDSRKHCQSMGADLAAIETVTEFSELNYFLDPIYEVRRIADNIYWVYLNKTVMVNQTWSWVHAYDPVYAVHWCKNFPSEDSLDLHSLVSNGCAMISSNDGLMWCFKNTICAQKMAAICEKKSEYVHVPPVNCSA